MEFRILGPLEVVREGTLLDLGAARVRLLLALLLVRGGEVISADRLVEEFWDADPPETGRHHAELRLPPPAALGADAWRLESRPPGYQLKVSADELDARRFQELAEQGRDALAGGRPEVAAAYGDASYRRLVALKDRHDPDNLFRLNHNIPPSTIGTGAGTPKPAGARG
jgi:DNA-binding SARP family transcriptional activator